MYIPKLWFRKANQCWYVQLNRHQINLGPDEEEATKKYGRILSGEGYKEPDELKIADLVTDFVAWSGEEHEPETTDWYRRFLADFSDRYGRLEPSQLKPYLVRQWYARKSWMQATRRCAVVCVRRLLSWAVGEGLLKHHPLPNLKAPPPKSRDRILAPGEREKILEAAKEPFRTFLWALYESGARPGEVARVAAENLHGDTWVFDKHKTTKRTGKPRTVYLTPALAELCRKLAEHYPDGRLFRNSEGNPWNRNSIRIRFRNLRRKLKLKGVVAYTLRHTFCTDGLENEVPIATMAELLGHTSTRMVQLHYNHLREKHDHLRRAVLRVRNGGGASPSSPPPGTPAGPPR